MATVNHVRVNNVTAVGATAFTGFSQLTRALTKAGWKYKASSDGTTKDSSGDPNLDKWGGTGTLTNAGAAAASITTLANGRATVTGLSGIIAGDKGRFLVISNAANAANNHYHQIEEIISATSVRIDARAFAVVGSDANNGSITWSIRDRNTTPLGFTGVVAWWCAQGPSVLKIPITAASVGDFEIGENLLQSSTQAEGELLGYTYYNGTGWLVVAPRLRGSGSGVWGWDTGNLITGGYSAATVTQVGAAVDYVYEIVLAKPSTDQTIQILMTQAATVGAEATELFSFCATQAGCTAAVHPGGGGTGNAFGAHAWVVWGTGSAPGSGLLGVATSLGAFPFSHNFVCVDAIPEQNYSADGSWSMFTLNSSNGTAAPTGGMLFGFHRLENTEEGELSPYVTIAPGGVKTLYTFGRTSSGTLPGITHLDMCRAPIENSQNVATRTYLAGWRGRGVLDPITKVALEYFTEYEAAHLLDFYSPAGFVLSRVLNPSMRMGASASPYAKTREPIWVVSAFSANAPYCVKGTFRWLYMVSGDQVTDVYGTDPAWTQLSSNSSGAMVLGPTDGTAWFLSF